MSARASDFPSEAQYSVLQNTRWPRFVETLRSTCLLMGALAGSIWLPAHSRAPCACRDETRGLECGMVHERSSCARGFRHVCFFCPFVLFFCHRQYSISGRQRAGGQDLVWQLWATTSSTTSSEPVNKRWRPHTQGSVTLVDIDSHTGQDSSPQGCHLLSHWWLFLCTTTASIKGCPVMGERCCMGELY